MISDCSSIRMQSTNCCFTSVNDIALLRLPVDLCADLAAPQLPRAHCGGLVDDIRESAFFGIQRSDGCIACSCCKSGGPVLDSRIDFRVDSPEYGCLERWSARHASVCSHQHDILAAQNGS